MPREETSGKCVIPSKWVFKIKSDNAYKSRCVGRGFQQWNTSIDSAFSLVARLGTVRLMLALSTIYGLDLWQQDVVCAFLNAKLGAEDTVYMEVPECYSQQFPGQVLKLNKAIYGLKSTIVEQNTGCFLWRDGLQAISSGSMSVHSSQDD